jgi:benzoyl-CoA reductase/2-hydroxyglutaryl-CoA dehydratase subunit BcrC/BadD/HgdB
MSKINKEEAIQKLKGLVDKIDSLKNEPNTLESPEFKRWKRKTEITLEHIFGKNSKNIKELKRIDYYPSKLGPWSPIERITVFQNDLENTKVLLNSMIEEIEEFWEEDKSPENINEGKKTMSDLYNEKSIWELIETEYNINKKQFGKRINFVKEKFKHNIIFRDVGQAFYLAKNGFNKPAVILSGGIIEELLRFYLESHKIKSKGETFEKYLDACVENKLLKSAISKLSDSFRHFRNLVHLQREKSKKDTLSKSTAIGAVATIFTLINDFERKT